MTATVPRRVIDLGAEGVVSGARPSGAQWGSMVAAYNAIDGMPTALIPLCAPYFAVAGTAVEDLDSLELTFTTWPRYQATHRLWFYLFQGNAAGSQTVKFQDPSGGTSYGNFDETTTSKLIAHIETIGSRSGAETKLTCSFGINDDSYIRAFGCYELPRPFLAVGGSLLTSVDSGADETVIRAGLPIADDYNGRGAGFLARELNQLRDVARRPGLFAAAPFWDSTSATFVDVMQTGPIVLGRGLYNGVTSSMMQLAFEVSATSGSGEVRATMTSGATVTLPFGSGSSTLRTQIAIDAEDIGASDGRRSSRDEAVTVAIRRASGAGIVTLRTVIGGEGNAASAALVSPAPRTKPPRFGRGPLPEFMSRKRRTR